jgi:hypothetical protein
MNKTTLAVIYISCLIGAFCLLGFIVVVHNAVSNNNGNIPDAFPYASGMIVTILLALAAIYVNAHQHQKIK